jgi:hypothetical protein
MTIALNFFVFGSGFRFDTSFILAVQLKKWAAHASIDEEPGKCGGWQPFHT